MNRSGSDVHIFEMYSYGVGPLSVLSRRAAIHGGCKMHITYRDEQGRTSERTIWPVMIGYFETVRMLAAWCELRQDFRHFRIDRLALADFTNERYPARRAELRNRWRETLAAKQRTGKVPAPHR